MILIALGANRAGPWGSPEDACRRALDILKSHGISIACCSPFYRTAPLGPQNQPSYVNAVAALQTDMPPVPLLRLLKDIERAAGRRGGRRWGARELDLDLLAHHGRVIGWQDGTPPAGDRGRRRARLVLPHPEMTQRGFVLRPLCDVAPGWHHPVSGQTAFQLLRGLKELRARRSVLRRAGTDRY